MSVGMWPEVGIAWLHQQELQHGIRSGIRHDEHMWWWCLAHSSVEPDAGCAHQVRLGPFDSVEAAEQAIARARQRNEQWDDAENED